MANIGLLCPPVPGHLNPMCGLGAELARRGHRVTSFACLDAGPTIKAAGLHFYPFAEEEFPEGEVPRRKTILGELTGRAALKYTIEQLIISSELALKYLPDALRNEQIDLLLNDEISPQGCTIAEHVGIPFVTVSNAIMIRTDESIPPWVSGRPYETGWWPRLKNQLHHKLINLVMKPQLNAVNDYRVEWGLSSHRHLRDAASEMLHLVQQPRELEFPREHLPETVHFVGTLANPSSRGTVEFPFHRLNGKPLIYASMGTLQNRLHSVFGSMIAACRDLDAQLVLTYGGAEVEVLGEIPDSTIVVPFAPQLELIQRASLVVTHAGLNTTLESLSQGVPLVMIPITNDQPAVAARVERVGAGKTVPLKSVSPESLRTAINEVLDQAAYRDAALALQQSIVDAGGVVRAADLCEQLL